MPISKKGILSMTEWELPILKSNMKMFFKAKRSVKEIHLDKHGNMESVENVEEGSKGNNIKLTVDLAFQNGVDDLLKSYFNSELGNGGAKYSEGVYAVALNPKNRSSFGHVRCQA